MALTFTTGMTLISDGDSLTDYDVTRFAGSGQAPSASLDTTVKHEGTGSIGAKLAGNNWNAAIIFDWYASTSGGIKSANTTVNLSTVGNEVISMIVQMTTPAVALGIASDGFYIGLSSSADSGSTNPTVYSEWTVGGVLNGTNGFKLFLLDTRKTPTQTTGGGCDLTAVRRIFFGVRNIASVGNVKADNTYLDLMTYGRPIYTVTGDGSTVATFISIVNDSLIQQNKLFESSAGVFVFNCGIQVGDNAQSATTEFVDANGLSFQMGKHTYENGTSIVDALNYEDYYGITVQGAASFNTKFVLGTIVGTGDDRKGILGGFYSSQIPYGVDIATDIAHISEWGLFGCSFTNAQVGFLLDGKATAADGSMISCSLNKCGEVNPGSTNNGAEILDLTIINPTDFVATENFGLRMPSTTHRIKKVSLITSGTPAIQHMVHLSQAADYTISFDEVIFFGDFSSGTLWHGENSGLNADVTVSPSNGANPVEAEFENTDSGTVDVTLAAATTTITCLDIITKAAIKDVLVTVKATATGDEPFEDVVTITQTGGTASVAHTAHGMVNGDKVLIEGAVEDDYNGIHAITNVTTNAYDYTVINNPSSPATGTIVATAVFISGLTDASGQISDTRVFSSDQGITGDAKKGSATPVYKPGEITGTIDNVTGTNQTVLLIED